MELLSIIFFVFGLTFLILYYLLKREVGNAQKVKADAQKAVDSAMTVRDQYREEAKKIQEDSQRIQMQLQIERDRLQSEIRATELQAIVATSTIDGYENLKSDEIQNQLLMLRKDQEEAIKTEQALKYTSAFNQKKKTEQNNLKKQILRCFNAEVTSAIEGVTVRNVDTVRGKINRTYELLNKIFDQDGIAIRKSFFNLKLKELSFVYSYMTKLEEEKEIRKAIREQMVEEEKVRRELEKAKQKLDKDEAQFQKEINKLMIYMQKSQDEAQTQLYKDKIDELEQKIKEVEANRADVENREANAKAGFVYIISNIGSFGENVFKIGMTRRLEPMDRIAELSSASVPFPFDVHALIFSDDAPALEAVLHQHFTNERVNKINTRKEFFRVELEKIKTLVQEKHNATTKFIDIPEAAEYRETLKLEAQ